MSDTAHSWQRLAYTCSAEGVLNRGLMIQHPRCTFYLALFFVCGIAIRAKALHGAQNLVSITPSQVVVQADLISKYMEKQRFMAQEIN